MELILTEDVENLGEVGEKIEVADGYGRNYLLPKGVAVEPTVGNERRYAKVRKEISQRREERRSRAEERADEIDGLELVFNRKAQEEHHLYGSVRDNDIVDSIKKETGIELTPEAVRLDSPIEELGQFGVEIRLYEDIHANVKVNVEEEESSDEESGEES